jgi:thiol:disulfide interchange protein DsbD
MQTLRKSLALASLLGLAVVPAFSQESEQVDPKSLVQVRLHAAQSVVSPGSHLTVAVEFAMAKDWHIYWTNPGDTGMPTSVSLTVQGRPDIVLTPEFPIPEVFTSPGDLTSFGYSGTVAVIAETKLPEDLQSPVVVELRTRYLMCKDRCIPGASEQTISIEVGSEEQQSEQAEQIEQWKAALPKATAPNVSVTREGDQFVLNWAENNPRVEGLGKNRIMLFVDRTPGWLFDIPKVTTADGKPLGDIASGPIRITVPVTVSEPARAKGQTIHSVLAWVEVAEDGTRKPVQGTRIQLQFD